MGVVINTNVASLMAQGNLQINNNALKVNVSRLSSGYRINSAADDAAGLARSDQLRANSRGIQAAMRNANDGISALEIADKSAEKVGEILTRMNELAVSASTGLIDDEARGYLNEEFKNLRAEIGRISSVTEFDGKKILDGAVTTTMLDIQIGFRNVTGSDRITLTMGNVRTNAAGLNLNASDLSTAGKAQTTIDTLKAAITSVNTMRARFGSNTNRLQATVANLSVTYTNFQAAESRIRDADFAQETASFTRNQILVQSGVSVLAQANSLPQSALALLS